MDEWEIDEQRKIGKQLMIINILKSSYCDNQLSDVNFEDLVEWSDLDSEEINLLIEVYNKLRFSSLTQCAAIGYTEGKPAEYCEFIYILYNQLGKIIFGVSESNIQYYKNLKTSIVNRISLCFENRLPDEYTNELAIDDAMAYFKEFVVSTVYYIIECGIDISIVKKCLDKIFMMENIFNNETK